MKKYSENKKLFHIFTGIVSISVISLCIILQLLRHVWFNQQRLVFFQNAYGAPLQLHTSTNPIQRIKEPINQYGSIVTLYYHVCWIVPTL